jgi:HK97 family phage major capsid protein
VPGNAGRDGLRNSRATGAEDRQRWGFRNFGEFCMVVKDAALHPGDRDARLIQNALTTYGSEGSGADGGFAVPPEWRSQIMKISSMAEDSLLSRTDQQIASGNSITYPVDETTAWQTTGGILAYWDSRSVDR